MAWTYEWEIERLKVKDEVNNDGVTLQNAVCQTYWKVTGTNDAGNSASFSGATPLSAAAVGEDDFTDFASLTEDQVIGWIRGIVEGPNGYMDHINEVLAKDIGQQEESEIENQALPWAPEPEANTTPTPTPEAATGSE
jgi:hypothetical protein